MNDIEIALMSLKPCISVIRNAGRPGRMNSWLVSHRQRYQLYALLFAIIFNPIDHVAVGRMASEKKQDSYIVARPFQRVGETRVRGADASVARWPLDFPRRDADARETGPAGNFNFGQ